MRGLNVQLVLAILVAEDDMEFLAVGDVASTPFQGVITRASFQALTKEFSDP